MHLAVSRIPEILMLVFGSSTHSPLFPSDSLPERERFFPNLTDGSGTACCESKRRKLTLGFRDFDSQSSFGLLISQKGDGISITIVCIDLRRR